jgi:DUF4097 and DUF4098 domain-containing protein YvlB
MRNDMDTLRNSTIQPGLVNSFGNPNLRLRLACAFTIPILALFAMAASGGEFKDMIVKTFDVKPGGTLIMEVDRGSIDIKTSAHDSIRVEVERKKEASSSAQAQEAFDAHKITFDQDGNTLTIKAKGPQENNGPWWSFRRQIQVRYSISIPSEFSIDVKTAGGSVSVGSIKGAVHASTAGGSINFGKITGDAHAQTAGGSIDIAGATGNVDANTAGGSIHVGETGGKVNVRTAGGSIHIDGVRNGLEARTSGGSVNLTHVGGIVNAQTSGGSISAEFSEAPTGACTLHTAGGGIDVTLDPSWAIDLDAQTSAGGVDTQIPVTIEGQQHRSVLRGKINGGGPRLELRTSAGRIEIRKR